MKRGQILQNENQSLTEMDGLEERFRFFAENVRDVMFIQDMNFRLIYVSPSVKSVFGYDPEELHNVHKIQYMTPESYERALRDFRRYAALAQKDPNIDIPLMQYEYVRKDGSTFTTKEIGKGTGLGLAMVYSIVKAHEGYITCQSKVGQGTTFDVYLPVSNGRGPFDTVVEKSPVSYANTGARILLVDDEEMILKTTRPILEHYGFEVLTAMSGEEALEVFNSKEDKIDLIMLDLGMPGMGGKRCLEELRKVSPSIKVIIASGYGPGEQDNELATLGISGFVGKPYKVEKLIGAINEALSSP